MYRLLHSNVIKYVYAGILDASPLLLAAGSELIKLYNEIAGNISVTVSIIYTLILIHEKIKNRKK